jgi:3-phenylpropionate/trans-cinnamate dioxygenase ferredoxin subunit
MVIEIDAAPLVIFRIAGELFAIGDVCSHDDGPLGDGELIDHTILCPRHGARFDVRSGGVLSLPAVVDIPAYPVRESGGQIEVGLPLLPE